VVPLLQLVVLLHRLEVPLLRLMGRLPLLVEQLLPLVFHLLHARI
jgi:hypothetical protein